jgi:hypothetical protein
VFFPTPELRSYLGCGDPALGFARRATRAAGKGAALAAVSPAEQYGVRLHNAPNARFTFCELMHVPAGYTTNPALDASIISNPGSPCSEWGNMKLDCPAQVPWTCPSWSS